MLSRPQTMAYAPADRGQSATVFTLLGAMFGALLVLAALWFQSLAHSVQEQSAKIETMVKAQEKATAAAKEGISDQRVSAKEEALDSILGDLKVDPSSPRVTAKLSQVMAQRAEALREVSRMKVEKEALADKATSLDSRTKATEIELAIATKKLNAAEKESADSLKEVKDKLEKAEEDMKEQDRQFKDNVSGTLQKRYNWAWYFAIAGWAGFLVCGIWLLIVVTREPTDVDRRDEDRPMHTTISIT